MSVDPMFASVSASEKPAKSPAALPKLPLAPVPKNAPEMRFQHPKFGQPAGIWPYYNAAGELMFYVARFDYVDEMGNAQKEYSPIAFCDLGNGVCAWRAKKLPDPQPLYESHQIARQPEALIMVTEGEKAANAAKILFPDLIVTTSAFGAKAADKTDW